MSTGVLQLQRSHSSHGNQHAHLLQYRPTVLESTRYHQPSSSGTLRSCRSCSSSTPGSSSISRTSHNRSHRFVHSPLHDSTCRRPICLIIRHRHHDDVDSRHPKYTVSNAPISAGEPSHSSFSHSHGNRSVHFDSLVSHSPHRVSQFPFFALHKWTCPLSSFCYSLPSFHILLELHPILGGLTKWFGVETRIYHLLNEIAPILCRLQLRASSMICFSRTVLVVWLNRS